MDFGPLVGMKDVRDVEAEAKRQGIDLDELLLAASIHFQGDLQPFQRELTEEEIDELIAEELEP